MIMYNDLKQAYDIINNDNKNIKSDLIVIIDRLKKLEPKDNIIWSELKKSKTISPTKKK